MGLIVLKSLRNAMHGMDRARDASLILKSALLLISTSLTRYGPPLGVLAVGPVRREDVTGEHILIVCLSR